MGKSQFAGSGSAGNPRGKPGGIVDLEPLMQGSENDRARPRKRRQRGSEMIEFSLVLLPFLGFTFLILNIAYAVYSRSTLQNAVAQGCRYAVTSQVMTTQGLTHARASIQKTVQQNSFGKLSANNGTLGTNGWNNIYVDWFLVDANTGVLVSQDGITGGNCMQTDGTLPLVQVSVQNLGGRLFLPFVKSPGMGSLSALTVNAVAWDRMEAPAISNGGYVCPPQ